MKNLYIVMSRHVSSSSSYSSSRSCFILRSTVYMGSHLGLPLELPFGILKMYNVYLDCVLSFCFFFHHMIWYEISNEQSSIPYVLPI